MPSAWIWKEGGQETMHPFWAVRRMTAQQLARAKADVKPGRLSPRFNCEIVMHHLTTCVITATELQTYSRARIFEVPFLTNSEELEEGEELILEIAERIPKQTPTKRSWKDVLRQEEKEKDIKKRANRDQLD